ncbi:VanZ family protein [Streptomyces olivaceiscleroticus]|uniref:VanZ family protein n=1 Tax=Streptomyces olivaceiscleroticus TaxID=68245 RepID=A0ABP3KVR0_9ACTN
MRAAGFVLLLAHLSVVYWLTLRPRTVPWVPEANLRPLETIRTELALGPWEAVQHLGGAVLLMAPLGVLLPMAGGRLTASALGSFTRTVFTGAMIAFVVALLQGTVPGRVPDIDTVLLNTLGVVLAHLVVVPAYRARLRRREDPRRGRTPTIARVGIAPQADVLSGSRT